MHLDDNGIVDMMNSEDPDDIDEEEEISEDDITQPCPVSHKEAMAMFEKCFDTNQKLRLEIHQHL